MLKLRIENYDSLPDGGPLEFSVDRRGFDLGRDQHLDWTLPDNNRVVSGKHCEIRFYDGAYWLTDISTNGTFLNGSSKRIQSPHRLSDGDRLSIGEYVVAVSVKLAAAATPPHPVEPMRNFGEPVSSANIWDTAHQAPPPIDADELRPRSPEADRLADFLHHAAYVPAFDDPVPVRKPAPPAPSPAPPPASSANHWGDEPDVQSEIAKPAIFEPAPHQPAKVEPAQPVVTVNPARSATTNDDPSRELLDRFAAGLGVPADLFAGGNAGDMAEDAGRLLNLACLHVMAMLRARSEAKALSRSGSRTMISSEANNPLKFLPTPEEALRVMLGPKTRGYLDAKASVDAAFGDLKMHHVAMLAAMQSSVTELFDDLSPDAIKNASDAKKSLLSTGKGRYWEIYSERWAARVGRNEHGMLGAFLDLFAEHYDKLSSSPRNRKP